MVSPEFPSRPSPQEREMTCNQRGLVETCFEEGQYESGIAALEQLRSKNIKPPVSLIRQLIYIALYPPPPSFDIVEERDFDHASPSKGTPGQEHRAQKVSFTPSPSASEAAQRLLLSFVRTNTPACLFQALPQLRNNARRNELPFESDDSVVAKESLCIKDAQHCWAILKEGFVPRMKHCTFSLAGKRKRIKMMAGTEEYEESRGNTVLAPVAEHAWLVLQWLIELFQQDEFLTYGDASAKHSPLLLLQIPPSRGATGLNAPLNIVFHCVSQSQRQQRQLGLELMALLIRVCLTAEVDSAMFLEQVTSRLYSGSPEIVQTFMSGLQLSQPVQIFKLALCRKFLSDDPGGRNTSPRRPKPQARAVKAVRGLARARENMSFSGVNDSGGVSLPPTADIVDLLTQSDGCSCSPAIMIVKKELLISYGYLQQNAERQDMEWRQLATGGGLEDVVSSVFGGELNCIQQDRDALISLVRIWGMN